MGTAIRGGPGGDDEEEDERSDGFDFRGVSVGPLDDGTARSMLPALLCLSSGSVFCFITYGLGDRVPGGISRSRSPNVLFFSLASGGFGQGSAVGEEKKRGGGRVRGTTCTFGVVFSFLQVYTCWETFER